MTGRRPDDWTFDKLKEMARMADKLAANIAHVVELMGDQKVDILTLQAQEIPGSQRIGDLVRVRLAKGFATAVPDARQGLARRHGKRQKGPPQMSRRGDEPY